MALKLKVLRVPTSSRERDDDNDHQIINPGEGTSQGPTAISNFDPGEGTSEGPSASLRGQDEASLPQAEARTRHHVYNQTVVQGW